MAKRTTPPTASERDRRNVVQASRFKSQVNSARLPPPLTTMLE